VQTLILKQNVAAIAVGDVISKTSKTKILWWWIAV